MAGWRGVMPAMAGPRALDLARAGCGAALGLLLTGLLLRGAGIGWLIAPFGASAVLVYAVPNSPLAQPWSVVVGNGASAVVALTLTALLPPADWVVPLAVGTAIAAMLVLRALHPPGGAVALLLSLGGSGGWGASLATVLAGSVALVGVGVLWNRATGRAYPFRQPAQAGAHGTTDPAPQARIGVDPAELQAILEDYRQSANLGVADLARLVGAVEQAAAARRLERFTAADIMSRDLVTVEPEAPLSKVADLFRRHGFTSLPVTEGPRLVGVIFQIDLIRRAQDDAFRQHHGLLRSLTRLVDRGRARPPKAGAIMETGVARVAADTPVGALLPLLSDGGSEAVPVLDGARLVGIVTRTDLVSALARRLALGAAPAEP
ncbi:MAG: HPP family protein [Tabrizicola flagellatus]|uniref:HPP family protein n=1 Tax=Tabrizicola flagellatus TaxID=2593021 RepID=UPI00391900D3